MSTFGDEIRRLRIEAGLSQKELAAATHVSPIYIARVETGKVRPSIRLLTALAHVLEASLSQLLIDSGYIVCEEYEEYKEVVKNAIDQGILVVMEEMPVSGLRIGVVGPHRRRFPPITLESLANRILTQSLGQDYTPPIDIVAVARFSGFRIKWVSSGDRFCTIIYPNIWLLSVNTATSSPDSAQRFAIAHELAHAYLYSLYSLSRLLEVPRGSLEVEASSLAAALVMPKDLVKRYTRAVALSDPVTRYALALRFGVSVYALEVRLIQLGLVDRDTIQRTDMPIATRTKIYGESDHYRDI